MGVISGWRTKFLQAMWQGQNKNNKLAVSCWVLPLPSGKKRKGRRRRRRRHTCLPAGGWTPAVPGSPSAFPPASLSCRKFQGALGVISWNRQGTIILLWGPFGIAVLLLSLVSVPRVTEFPDHRARPVFPHMHPQWTANSRYSMNAH